MSNTRTPVDERDDFAEEHGYRQFALDYRRHLRARGLSDGTVRLYLHVMDILHSLHPDLARVTTRDLEAWLSARRNTLSAETRRTWRKASRSFYEFGLERGYFDHNPAAALRPVRLPRTQARIADDSKLEQALLTATLPEKAMILLGRDACLRLSEIAKLHSSDREGDVLFVLGKGEHVRSVPIDGSLARVLHQLEVMQGPGYYFPGRWDGYIHPQSLNKIIKRVTGTNPHSLRHAGGTAAYQKTGDIRAVQELLGHVSLVTTQRYVHVGLDAVREAVKAGALDYEQPENLTVFDRAAFNTGG